MSGMELATIARYGMNPIVVVFDNDGYGTERPMLDGAFNDVHRWNFAHPGGARRRPRHQGRDRNRDGGGAEERPRQHSAFTIIQVMLPKRPFAGPEATDRDAEERVEKGKT